MNNRSNVRKLPVVLPIHADELLSSWIERHSAYYAVPPMVMLRHAIPEMKSLRQADLRLTDGQAVRLASIFRVKSDDILKMTFNDISPASRQLIATRPVQRCPTCENNSDDPQPIFRSQLLGWRITCPKCGSLFLQPTQDQKPSPFHHYINAAIQGERLLDKEASRGKRSWASPAGLARLLLMRRRPYPVNLPESELWRFRVLGKIIPGLEDILTEICTDFPTPQNLVLPLHLRPALLAGVAIVHSAGAEMLFMLRQSTFAANQTHFDHKALPFFLNAEQERHSNQIQLI